MEPVAIIIIFFVIVVIWLVIVEKWATREISEPAPKVIPRCVDNLSINQVVPISQVSPIDDHYLMCQFSDDDFIQLNHTEGLAVWGNFSDSEYISVFIEDSNRRIVGKITNLELDRHVCVIFTSNQSITTNFRQRLHKLYDLKDSAFKVVPLYDLSLKYRVLIYYRGRQPIFTATRYTIPNLYNLPFHVVPRSSREFPPADDGLFDETLRKNCLRKLQDIEVTYDQGYFISQPTDQKIAILTFDRVKNNTGYDSHILICHDRTIVDQFHNSGRKDFSLSNQVRLVVYQPKQKIQVVERVDVIDRIPPAPKIYIVG